MSLSSLLVLTSFSLSASCSLFDGGNILCFGDELTAGISKKEDTVHTPYANTLQTLLPNAHIKESSVYGEFAYHMRKRLDTELPNLEFKNPSVVVLWSGINDVSKHTKVNTTVNHIISMHESIRMKKTQEPVKYGGILHTVLVTIPQLKAIDLNRDKRLKVNHRLRRYAAGTDGFVVLLDIENVFHYSKHCVNTGSGLHNDVKDVNTNSRHTRSPPHTSSSSTITTTQTPVRSLSSDTHHDHRCHGIPVNPAYIKYWDRPSFWTMSPAGYAAIGRMVYETICNQSNSYYLV